MSSATVSRTYVSGRTAVVVGTVLVATVVNLAILAIGQSAGVPTAMVSTPSQADLRASRPSPNP